MAHAGAVDRDHDRLEVRVDLGARPREPLRVLRHLEAGGRDAPRVARLAGRVEHVRVLEDLDRLRRARHVRALGDAGDLAGDEALRILAVELVLRRAGQRDVDRQVPGPLAGLVRHADAARVVGHAPVAAPAHLDQRGELLAGEALGIVRGAARVRDRHDLRAERHRLLDRELRDVAGARHRDAHALERHVPPVQHLLDEVDEPVAGRLGPDQAPAERESLAGEHAGGVVRELLVHARHVAHLARAHADVARGHVGVRAEVAVELEHQRLAEAHHLVVAAALGVEVRSALAAAHRQRRQRVLERLLEAQELEDRQVDRRVEAHPALVGADRARVLDAPGAVHVHRARVVDPRDAELDHPLGLDDAVEQPVVRVLGVRLDERPHALHHLAHRLVELGLLRIARAYALEELLQGTDVHRFAPGVVIGDGGRLYRRAPSRPDDADQHGDDAIASSSAGSPPESCSAAPRSRTARSAAGSGRPRPASASARARATKKSDHGSGSAAA